MFVRKSQLMKACHSFRDYLHIRRTVFTKPTLLNRKFNVCIEGNIGSGKSTFLEYFRPLEKIVEINKEPIELWRNISGENPLAMCYEDPKRWSSTFQSLVMLSLVRMHKQTQEKPVRMMERSIYSSQFCFVENLHQSGHLTSYEYAVLTEWFSYIIDKMNINIDLIVYLQTCPSTCWERIQARARPEEQNITLQYLQDLHHHHDNWLVKGKNSTVAQNIPVVVINGDNDRQTMEDSYRKLKSKILFGLDKTTTII